MARTPTGRTTRNRANVATVPTVPIGSFGAPVMLVSGAAAPDVPAVDQAEADLRRTMERLCGGTMDGAQIIAKRVMPNGEERWLANLGVSAWNEPDFARRYGAGSYALYVYAQGDARGRVVFNVDESCGAGQPPPGLALAANQVAPIQPVAAAGSSDTMQMHFMTLMTTLMTTMMTTLKSSGGGLTIADYIKLQEVGASRTPKLADIDAAVELGMKVAGANADNVPAWVAALQSAIPIFEPLSRAAAMRLAAPSQRRIGAGSTNGGKPNQAAQGARPNPAVAHRADQSAVSTPNEGAGAGGQAGNRQDSANAGPDGAMTQAQADAETEQAWRMLAAILLRAQPHQGEEDERDPVTYANITVDVLGMESVKSVVGGVPPGELGNTIAGMIPNLAPSVPFLVEVERELREIIAEEARAEAANTEPGPVAGRIGTPPIAAQA